MCGLVTAVQAPCGKHSLQDGSLVRRVGRWAKRLLQLLSSVREQENQRRGETVFYINEPPLLTVESELLSDTDDGNIVAKKPLQRTLWCETAEVRESAIMRTMTSSEKALNESKFEILTSEVSYLKSLNVLITLFVESAELAPLLSAQDRNTLFANILAVRSASESFLYEVAGHWEQDVLLRRVCSIVHSHAINAFRVYIDYCANQVRFQVTLARLVCECGEFRRVLAGLEACPECESYSLQSFLLLPMQRVTRLPLLMEALLRRLGATTSEFEACRLAHSALNQLVHECNDALRSSELYDSQLVLNELTPGKGFTETDTLKSPHKKKSPVQLSSAKHWKLFHLPRL